MPSFDLHGVFSPNDTQYDQIKRSVRSTFSQRVAQAIAVPSKNSTGAVPEPAVKPKSEVTVKAKAKDDVLVANSDSKVLRITDLLDYLRELESENLVRDLTASEHATSLVRDEGD